MENLLLDDNFNLKIGDFGFATNQTQSSESKGTRQYKAPEIEDVKENYVPEKVDVFAAGSVLFTMTVA